MPERERFGRGGGYDVPTHERPSREMLFLAEQAVEGKIKALPSDQWAFHYPVDAAARDQKLRALLDGTASAEDVAVDIQPDALLYNAGDIATEGLEAVSARIRDLTGSAAHFDYPRFVQFVQSMRGRDIALATIESLYRGITKARTQKKLYDAYGETGREQIGQALRTEADEALRGIAELPRGEKVFKTLKLNWLCEEMGTVRSDERDRAVAELSGDERDVYRQLEASYRAYVNRGDELGYDELVARVHEGFPKITQEPKTKGSSGSMEELEKELEPLKEEVGPPGGARDPGIPPEDSDEYHTPPSFPDAVEAKGERQPIFTVIPPLSGHYAAGRKSYFDISTKTWSKKKQLARYDARCDGDDRHTISGATDGGTKALPLPNGYAIDAASFQYSGAELEFFRDQNGCFYIRSDGPAKFSVDFLQEPEPFVGPPIPEDTVPLSRGALSEETERVMDRLSGNALQKAEQVRQYILANHFYPAGGDLHAAQALQHKLRSESTGENYLQNIDASEYLECYSANTKFVAMMRRAGVPSRLVVGHRVEGAREGQSVMDSTTGHAWAEVWDGSSWRRFDATPKPKPEDEKPPEPSGEKQGSEPAKEAEDGGVESPPKESSKQEGQGEGKKGKQSDAQGEPKDAAAAMEDTAEASDAQRDTAASELERAQERVEEVMEKKRALEEKIDAAEKFKDLAETQKDIESSDIFDDLKEELKKKAEAKEQQKKEELREKLDDMANDGFIDEQEREKLEEKLDDESLEKLDRVEQAIDQEARLYDEYDALREEVRPSVEKWFRFFVERLPKEEEVGTDEDSLTRQGAFNRRSVTRYRNLLFGTVKNPRRFLSSIKPMFIADVLGDVSGSMAGEKLEAMRKLIVFYNELFSAISQQYGYVRFSIGVLADTLMPIKSVEQEYDSPTRYEYPDGEECTVKVRLMKALQAKGGTNMLDAIKRSAENLNQQVHDYPEYASALYFFGDGGDTCGNAGKIKEFLADNDAEHGFGRHMRRATLMGDEAQRKELAAIFGEEATTVCPDFNELIEESMLGFADDIEAYLRDKTV